MDDTPRRLCWHGALLFLLGLVTGLFVMQLENPRMGLAAHLEGLMNGTFLLALGAAWRHVRLTEGAARLAEFSALSGAYTNWACTTLAAALGTASMTPLAAGSHRGEPWQEILVTVGFGYVGIAMVVAAVVILKGFGGRGETRGE